MIPAMHITAWASFAPWAELAQIEQDLVISRALIDLFNDEVLRDEMRFRGGTALNKLHFPQPLRYSEDIDLVRTAHGPIGPILDRMRTTLRWLGDASFEQSPIAPKLVYRIDPEHGGSALRLKIEINTRETETFDRPYEIALAVDNPWFSGCAQIPTFTPEEMLATKLRALLQRDKGRDLLDVAHALSVLQNLNTDRIVELFGKYLDRNEQTITRAQAEQRMWSKMDRAGLISDIRPLLSADAAERLTDYEMRNAFTRVFTELIALVPGSSWARTPEFAERFGILIGDRH